jgi:hypothetical protein
MNDGDGIDKDAAARAGDKQKTDSPREEEVDREIQ